MGQGNTIHVSSDGLSVVAAMAAANGGLHQAILALAACHGGQSGPWLDELEANLLRDTKNIVFEGVPIEDEAEAVAYALENLAGILRNVRHRLESASS